MLRQSLVLAALLLTQSANAADLPPYSGPFGVGTVDIEVPVEARNISQGVVNTTGLPAFEIETVLFSLFYPTEPGANSTKAAHTWLPQPQDLVANGFAGYAISNGVNADAQLIAGGIKAIAKDIVIPAQVDVPLAAGNASYPVFIFSHGDAGLRTFYSHLLGEVASHGCIVAAIEHRDGSAPATVEMKTGGFVRNITFFNAGNIVPPISEAEWLVARRAFRQVEVAQTIEALRNITNGGGESIFKENPRNEGENLAGFRNRLNFDYLLVSGHSFGATEVLQLLEPNATASIPATAAIIFDPGKDSGPLYTNITVPLVVADSQGWSSSPADFYGKPHFDVVKSAAQSSLDKTGSGWFMTLLGAAHSSITDAALIDAALLPYFDPGYNATIDPTQGVAQYVNVTLDFLAHVQNKTTTGVLTAAITDPEYNVSANTSEAKSVPMSITQYWEIHVAPGDNSSANGSTTGTSSSPSASATHKSLAPRINTSVVSALLGSIIAIFIL